METKEKRPVQGTAKEDGHRKGTKNQQITKQKADKCCLWFDPDTFDPIKDSISQIPAEKVPYGGYVPYVIGTRKQINSLIRKLEKKPCLAEKYIKIISR